MNYRKLVDIELNTLSYDEDELMAIQNEEGVEYFVVLTYFNHYLVDVHSCGKSMNEYVKQMIADYGDKGVDIAFIVDSATEGGRDSIVKTYKKYLKKIDHILTPEMLEEKNLYKYFPYHNSYGDVRLPNYYEKLGEKDKFQIAKDLFDFSWYAENEGK